MDAFQMASLANEAHHQLQPQDQDHTQELGNGSNKRKSEDGQQQSHQRAKRNRYISIACNECKRRKIKCNGQLPCQRCGNLNLECVYAPNCCNGFKDSQEYKDMAANIALLQEQVNVLYNDLNHLRAQLGQAPPTMQQMQQLQPPVSAPPQQTQQHASIDPSLHSGSYAGSRQSLQASPGAPIASMSPASGRPKSQAQNQPPSFRGPTSDEFQFGVANNSLQTMGIAGGAEEGSGVAGAGTANPSPAQSPPMRNRAHPMQEYHADKDPIWTISHEEAIRLCYVYEDEMGLMYPILTIEKVMDYATKLYQFMEAARRSGLMQGTLHGADSIEDEDTNLLKMVLATAMTVENGGRSDLGKKLFEFVQPAIDNSLLGSVGVKGIRLLTIMAMYNFNAGNEGTSWRLIGLTARLCIELGLHRRETYQVMQDETERSETILLFWAIYVLDRRWSFGTGMPFALQDADIDPLLPKPEDRSPYLSAMIQYSAIGSKVWRTVAATPAVPDGAAVNTDELSYLDYQVIQWHRNIPLQLRFEHPSQAGRLTTPVGPPPSRAGSRLRILLYLRANQMRILIYRPVLHSATSIMQYRDQAQTVVDVAKDTIRVLTHVNQTSDLYRTAQVMLNAFLTSALAVLFLAVSHAPAAFAENVREEFYMALDLVRGFSKGSFAGKRLWKTIRVLKELGPRLGLTPKNHAPAVQQQQLPQQQLPQQRQQPIKVDDDQSHSAALAMATLAGHNAGHSMEDMAIFNGNMQQWSAAPGASTSPDGMANDLTSLFEAVGGGQGHGNAEGKGFASGTDTAYGATPAAGPDGLNAFPGDEELSNILKELF